MKDIRVIHRTMTRLAAVVMTFMVMACSSIDEDFYFSDEPATGGATSGRELMEEERKVFILWSLGFNNLSSYLVSDLDDLTSGWLPGSTRKEDVVLAFCHNTAGAYSKQTSPVLMRIYRDLNGNAQRDTVLVLPKSTISASSETMEEVLTYIKDQYPAAGYGMLMSSHGTGWVPEGYCSNPSQFEGTTPFGSWRSARRPVPYTEPVQTEGMPMTKSIGCQNITSKSVYEIDITDMADAIPMKMDYIIFDACFMGGIEVAYELREACDKVIFSQTEILADGMDYVTMLTYLLENGTPDLEGFCRNYFDHYDKESGAWRSATISLVDCTRLEPLAQACREIFESYRTGIAALEGNYKVQRYYRTENTGHRWFFDLESIVRHAGASESEIGRLQAALEECVLYKAATKQFMQVIDIDTHSGLSMYLPYRGLNYLNGFYKGLEWNKATTLIK